MYWSRKPETTEQVKRTLEKQIGQGHVVFIWMQFSFSAALQISNSLLNDFQNIDLKF